MRKPPRRRRSIAEAIAQTFRADASAVARPVVRGADPTSRGALDRLAGSARHNFNDEANAMLRSASDRWRDQGDPHWNGGRPLGRGNSTPGAAAVVDPARLARVRRMTPYHLLQP